MWASSVRIQRWVSIGSSSGNSQCECAYGALYCRSFTRIVCGLLRWAYCVLHCGLCFGLNNRVYIRPRCGDPVQDSIQCEPLLRDSIVGLQCGASRLCAVLCTALWHHSGGLHRGVFLRAMWSPRGGAPCGDPLWVSSVRFDWGLQGWVPLWCSRMGLQCGLQDCVLCTALWTPL